MRLDFMHFLTASQNNDFVLAHPVICFVGSEYPLLFLKHMRTLAARTLPVEIIDVAQEADAVLKGRLATSFLGSRVAFILTGIEVGGRDKEKNILTYLETYAGPHTLLVYLTAEQYGDQERSFPTVVIPEKVDRELFCNLFAWCGMTITPSSKQSIKHLFDLYDSVTLEQACMLMSYIPLGISDNEFFDKWLHVIITSEQSMFSLSQYLFQKDSTLFFTQWKKMADAYSPQFWIAFWSEQVWRASMFIQLSKQRKFNDARKVSFRLPFSFMNRDWRRYSASELITAHDFLYRLDYRFKTTEHSIGLDLFYARFLSH